MIIPLPSCHTCCYIFLPCCFLFSGDSFSSHNGFAFSTRDKDNDVYGAGNCAVLYKGAWWYSECHSSNLNGLYLKGEHSSYANGVNWAAGKGHHYSYKYTDMKIRSQQMKHLHSLGSSLVPKSQISQELNFLLNLNIDIATIQDWALTVLC